MSFDTIRMCETTTQVKTLEHCGYSKMPFLRLYEYPQQKENALLTLITIDYFACFGLYIKRILWYVCFCLASVNIESHPCLYVTASCALLIAFHCMIATVYMLGPRVCIFIVYS